MAKEQLTYNNYIKTRLTAHEYDTLLKTNRNKSSVALIDILEEELNNFEYDGNNDLTYLLNIFDILAKLISNDNQLQQTLYNRFTYIHNYIRNLLQSHPRDMNDLMNERYKMLQKIIDQMENTMLQIYLDNPVAYDHNKEAFIEYVIFTLKYIHIVRDAIEKFPHIVNSIDNTGVSLTQKVVDHYLTSLEEYLSYENLGHIDDLIYYGKVLKLILDSDKVKIDDYSIKSMLEKIESFYKSKTYTNNRHKEKLSFFINDCINTLTRQDSEETIDYLNYKYEIHSKFKEAHMLEAKRIHLLNKKILTPTTKRKIYTFDGEGAYELDDGLSVIYEDGIYHLGVHIADPGSYIDFNNILMDEAIRRTTSLYYGDECNPLFPLILSQDTMSLNVGKQTYAISYYFDIDENTGELIDFNIKNEIVEVAGNLLYSDFDTILDKGTDNQELFETLYHLSNISVILSGIYNEDLAFFEFNHEGNSDAQMVVSNAMIYVGYHVAKYFDERSLPLLFRCHSVQGVDVNMLNKLEENLRIKDKTQDIIKEINKYKELMSKACYSRINIGHHGLGVPYYSHCTSPLRRLADSINNMCIKKFVLSNFTSDDIKKYAELVDQMAEQINMKHNSTVDYEVEYLRIKNRQVN